MYSYYGKQGTQYTLGEKIGAGGEGTVFRLANNPRIVAKIFHYFRSFEDQKLIERKLMTMIEMPIEPIIDGIIRFSWPLDILYEGNRCVGYTMPYIQNSIPYYDILRTDLRDRVWDYRYTWKYSVQFGYNLAWNINYLHDHDVIVGDMNLNNIRVTTEGHVILIDCAGFDITNQITGEHFPCTVGVPELLPPELQTVGDLKNGRFTKQSDSFSLAILLFRTLMENADPFGGISTINQSMSALSCNVAIVNGECPYVREVPAKKVPGWALPFDFLPDDLQQGFRNTFDYTAITALRVRNRRTTPKEWCGLLLKYGEPEPNTNLRICTKNRRHVYPANNVECPWCAKESMMPTTRVAANAYPEKGKKGIFDLFRHQ